MPAGPLARFLLVLAMISAIDPFLNHAVWEDTHRARLIPLCNAAESVSHPGGTQLFTQFHPAETCSLLYSGAVAHEATAGNDRLALPMGRVSWRWGALGWSGFIPPYRNGTTARTASDVQLLNWPRARLADIFYADPGLAVSFFRILLDSARRQFEWIRDERVSGLSALRTFEPLPRATGIADRRQFAPGLFAALRRSAFFQVFDDATLERLADGAKLVRCESGTEIVRQGQNVGGLWVLAAGTAVSYFSSDSAGVPYFDRFRTIPEYGGILAGTPALDGEYLAEAKVLAASTCWYYRIPVTRIEQFIADDLEFGRSLMQRHLGRLAHLISAARPPQPNQGEEPEIAAVRSILEHNQTRIPVTSELHKVPHLLSHRTTIGNAFACLSNVQQAGRYQERAIARTCTDLLGGVQAEEEFYRNVLAAYTNVTDASEDLSPVKRRTRCDEELAHAFSYFRTEIHGVEKLPPESGHIVIMNHLGCPACYRLPNNYHFSFDTAFVSVLLNTVYGKSPVRVVRQSPGAEYGHNLFYSRLGHITVPTVESGVAAASQDALAQLRREAADILFGQGQQALLDGNNILICPEGQSQRACDSPVKFFSGAFRLARHAQPEPYIVPIAIAGFDQRYKDAKLVAMVQKPFRLSAAMRAAGVSDLRAFLDGYRERFAHAVKAAQQCSSSRLLTNGQRSFDRLA